MAKIKGLTVTESDVSQTINLEELLGVDFRGQKTLRLAIAQRVIDHIVDRTQSGKSVSGDGFKPYSKNYKDSAEYKLLKDSSKVNLTLTGNMLSSIEVLGDGPNTVRIGFNDKTETMKAYAHQSGDGPPKREFFGVTMSEARDLIEEEFSSDLDALKGRTEASITAAQIIEKGVLRLFLDEANRLPPDLPIIFNTIKDL